MSRHLVYFAHGEAAALPVYAAALGTTDDVDIVLVRLEGKSSTPQVAARLLELTFGAAGGFVVRGFNTRLDDASEHRAALSDGDQRLLQKP